MHTLLLRLTLSAVLAVAAATALKRKPSRQAVPLFCAVSGGRRTDAAARAMQPELEKILARLS